MKNVKQNHCGMEVKAVKNDSMRCQNDGMRCQNVHRL